MKDISGKLSGRTGPDSLDERALKGYLAIQGLWKRNNTCILDIYVTDTDVKAYTGLSVGTMLEAAALAKKAKYLKACLEQRRIFVSLA